MKTQSHTGRCQKACVIASARVWYREPKWLRLWKLMFMCYDVQSFWMRMNCSAKVQVEYHWLSTFRKLKGKWKLRVAQEGLRQANERKMKRDERKWKPRVTQEGLRQEHERKMKSNERKMTRFQSKWERLNKSNISKRQMKAPKGLDKQREGTQKENESPESHRKISKGLRVRIGPCVVPWAKMATVVAVFACVLWCHKFFM